MVMEVAPVVVVEDIEAEDQAEDEPDGISSNDVTDAFGKYGSVKDLWMSQDAPRFGFIVFDQQDEAESAIKNLNDSDLHGDNIRVSWAKPRDSSGRTSRGGGGGYGGSSSYGGGGGSYGGSRSGGYSSGGGGGSSYGGGRGGGGGGGDRSCFNCGRSGHLSRDCRSSGSGGGGSRGSSRGRGSSSYSSGGY